MLVDHRLPSEQRPGGQGAAQGPLLVEVVQRDVDHAVRALDLLVVEVAVDLAVHVPGDGGDAGEPDGAHRDDQRARQAIGEALRAGRRHGPSSAGASR